MSGLFDAGVAQFTPLVIAIPVLGGCVLVAAGRLLPRPVVDGLATAVAAGVVGLDGWLLAATRHGHVVTWLARWAPVHGFSVGIDLTVDPVGAGTALVAAALVALALLYGWRTVDSADGHYQVLMLLFLAGMEGFALTGDLFDMFVFFELMGAVAYGLTGFKIEDQTAVQGALNFGIINSFGAYLSLAGVAVLYAHTGVLQLPQLAQRLSGHPAGALVVVAFVLVITGMLVKGAVAPFHFWLADAHAVAPSPVCVLFSGIMVELGLYGAFRVYWVVFSGTLPAGDIRRAFLVLAVVTAIVGALMCWGQRHLKRLLAYSTIAHVGLFLGALSALSPDGTGGAVLYVLGHAGAKSALFLLVGVLLNTYGSVDEFELHGRGRRMRVLRWLYFVAGLALCGLPPFGTALGHSISEDALVSRGYPWAPALYVLVSAVTGGAVLRAGMRVFFGWGSSDPQGGEPADAEDRGGREAGTSGAEERDVPTALARTPLPMFLAIVVLVLGSLVVGLDPGATSGAAAAGERFVDSASYVAQALHRAVATPATHPLASVGWTAEGVGLGVLSTVLAVLLAAAAVWQERLPAAARQLSGWLLVPVRRPLGVLRNAHSGHVGDYLAWLFAGVAGLAGLIGFPLR
jgi:multicomponent Na+:H+ antiporter subunit D